MPIWSMALCLLTPAVIQNIEQCLHLKKNQIKSNKYRTKDLGSTAEWPRRPRRCAECCREWVLPVQPSTHPFWTPTGSECPDCVLRRHWKTSWHESHWVSSKKTGASVVWFPVWRCWKMFEILSKCRADLFVPRNCDCHLFVMDLRKHSAFSHREELGRAQNCPNIQSSVK